MIVNRIFVHQTWKPGSLLLVHLGLSNSVLSLTFLLLSSPTILTGSPVAGLTMCQVSGFIVHLVNPLVIWNLAGIHLERFVAISHPLRSLVV